MEKIEFTQPDFFFCEIPIKNGSYNDNRIWIYHRLSLSLIEFINLDDFSDFKFNGMQKIFQYEIDENEIENYLGIYVQNNCKISNQDENVILNDAWAFLLEYFKWEDQ